MDAPMLMLESTMARGRGFTLIELVIAIGILMVLAGLLAPSIGASMERARLTRAAGVLDQNHKLVMLYQGDHGGAYPLAHERAYLAGKWWYVPLSDSGYIESVSTIDPDYPARIDFPTYTLATTMAADPKYFRRDSAVSLAQLPSRLVRADQVPYPAQKGDMVQFWVRRGRHDGFWCCAVRDVAAPVSFADGSVATGDWQKFHQGALFTIDGIGYPVVTTWGGYGARDR